jgi:hypothetical protein
MSEPTHKIDSDVVKCQWTLTDCAHSYASDIVARLELYGIASDVPITDSLSAGIALLTCDVAGLLLSVDKNNSTSYSLYLDDFHIILR